MPGSFVMRDIVMNYEFGDQKYCIAPILLDGEGGGYFAVFLPLEPYSLIVQRRADFRRSSSFYFILRMLSSFSLEGVATMLRDSKVSSFSLKVCQSSDFF